MEGRENKLLDRTFQFGVNTILFLRSIPDSTESKILKHQLIKAATSIAANYEEAQGAQSRKDFKHKIQIVLKEAREANYWLRLLGHLYLDNKPLFELIQESKELKNIIGAILIKLKEKSKD